MNAIDFTPTAKNEYWVIEPPTPLPYISLHAITRVRNPLPVPTACPYCGGGVKLVNNTEIYGKPIGSWPFAYQCQKCCEAYVGVHPDTAIPIGHLADKKLRTARQKAKQAFHDMIAVCNMPRAVGYTWLSKQLGLTIDQTHFGWFDVSWCQKAHQAVLEETNKCLNKA